ncbi:MAG: hypothetical protein BWK73_09250 [Thiothrix lacustris]|uniref:Uncharacterized protein n=1 Tax=Thiothrix lacustris TaxID=525917 RepID=A0A1Y1QVC7_9GAMM|nr:MAG: hypothetical protein BWK73_09250 [Thiothrix lacustris]
MYYKLQHIAFYFLAPVGRWLLAIFLVLNLLLPLIAAWSGDMIGMFMQQTSDELRGAFIAISKSILPEWMQ